MLYDNQNSPDSNDLNPDDDIFDPDIYFAAGLGIDGNDDEPPVVPDVKTCEEEKSAADAESTDPLDEDDLAVQLRRMDVEDDAVELQCLMDGHTDRERAAADREWHQKEREIYHMFKDVLESRSSLTLDEAREIVQSKLSYKVPDELIRKQFRKVHKDCGE